MSIFSISIVDIFIELNNKIFDNVFRKIIEQFKSKVLIKIMKISIKIEDASRNSNYFILNSFKHDFFKSLRKCV